MIFMVSSNPDCSVVHVILCLWVMEWPVILFSLLTFGGTLNLLIPADGHQQEISEDSGLELVMEPCVGSSTSKPEAVEQWRSPGWSVWPQNGQWSPPGGPGLWHPLQFKSVKARKDFKAKQQMWAFGLWVHCCSLAPRSSVSERGI